MNVLIISATAAPIGSIVASIPGADVTCLVVGSSELAQLCASGVPSRVSWIDTHDQPAESFTDAVARAAKTLIPDLIVCQDAPQDRALAAAAAAAIGASWVPTLTKATHSDGTLIIEGGSLEGRVIETFAVPVPAVAIYTGRDEGITGPPAQINQIDAKAQAGIEFAGVNLGGGESGLSSASRIIGIGRGITSRDQLPQIEELASAMDAATGCTLPISEDLHWYGEDRIIGRSGHTVKPDLYLALGLSGQPQHQDGIRDAKIVVAINTDPKAPIFKRAKYGIVASITDVCPALIEAVKN